MNTLNRVEVLKKRMLGESRYVSVEQAEIITETYKRHQNEPRILQRAYALKAALEKIKIRIDPEELIVGNRTAGVRAGVVFPESGSNWVDKEFETLPFRAQDTFQVREDDIKQFRKKIHPYWKGKSLEDILNESCGEELREISLVAKINQTDHAQGHICPNVKTWLEKGPSGLKKEAEQYLKKSDNQNKAFYESVIIAMDGAVAFLNRYAELARNMAAEDCENRETLKIVAENCEALAKRSPKSFHEALQSVWMLFVILQMESNASSFSPGRLDVILYPYYRKDMEKGIMNQDQALELIECLWLKFNQIVYMRNSSSAKYFAGFPIGFNIVIGGQDEQGNDINNALSFLFLQAQEDLGLPQPNLSVRLHEGSSEKLLRKAVQVVAKGSGMPQFFNDKAMIPALESIGVNKKDAWNYAMVGCVELSTSGNSLGWSDAAMFNLNKALELAVNSGIDLNTGKKIGPDYGNLAQYQSYEELEEAFAKEINYFMDRMIKACEKVEKAHAELLPTPFLSAVVEDCLKRGTDVTAGGAHYNHSGIQMIQIANLADSLAVLKKMIYEGKEITGEEMLAALRNNFEGYEILRAKCLNKVPKYGNDVKWVDELGVKWAKYFRQRLCCFTNYRGGVYHTGMYTVSAHVPMGENVGASPDGRLAKTPLADGGLSPMYGRDQSGPTAVLKTVSRIDKTLTSNGGLLNMKFLPSFFSTKSGIDKFVLFLRSFVDLEIPHIQFNVVSRESLLDAQRHPENHRSLTVRVAGYTAYFTELAEELQNEIIARTFYEDIA